MTLTASKETKGDQRLNAWEMSIYRSFLLFITAFLLLDGIPYLLLGSYYDHYFSEICPSLITIWNPEKVITEGTIDCEPIALWAYIIESEVFVISTSLIFAMGVIRALLSTINNIKTMSQNVASRILVGRMGVVIAFLSFVVLESSVHLLFNSPDILDLLENSF